MNLYKIILQFHLNCFNFLILLDLYLPLTSIITDRIIIIRNAETNWNTLDYTYLYYRIYILFVHISFVVERFFFFLYLYYNPKCSHHQSICSRQQLFSVVMNDYNSCNSRPLFYSHSHSHILGYNIYIYIYL